MGPAKKRRAMTENFAGDEERRKRRERGGTKGLGIKAFSAKKRGGRKDWQTFPVGKEKKTPRKERSENPCHCLKGGCSGNGAHKRIQCRLRRLGGHNTSFTPKGASKPASRGGEAQRDL